MSKKVSIGAWRTTRQPPASADECVGTRGETPEAPATPSEPTKRIAIDVPESLHGRVKVGCAMEGTSVAAEVRAFRRKRFPSRPPSASVAVPRTATHLPGKDGTSP